jgi:Mg2+-importing ATPase
VTKPPNSQTSQFWRLPTDALCTELGCTLQGLTATEAAARLGRFGPNSDAPPRIEAAGAAVADPAGRRHRLDADR